MRVGVFGLLCLAMAALWTSAGPSDASDPVPCTDLLPFSPANVAIEEEILGKQCVVRDRINVGDRKILFVDIVGYAVEGDAHRMRLAREAVERSIETYGRWFRIPDTLIVSGHFRAFTASLPDQPDTRVLATANGERTGCVIAVDDAARHAAHGDGSVDLWQFQRTIAHEFFHCIQVTDPLVDHGYVVWRDEGSADYFAEQAIPESRPNPVFYDRLSRLAAEPLPELGYSAYPFIAYLGRQRGAPAVVDLLRGAVRDDDSLDASYETLRTIPDVDTLFHDFVKAWLDGFLTDGNGHPFAPPLPRLPEPLPIERETVLSRAGVMPFVADIGMYQLGRGVSWELAAPDPDHALASWRVYDGAEWSRLRTTVDGCEEGKRGVILLTNTRGADAADFDIAIRENAEPMRNCTCPVGSWRMSTEDLRASPFARTMPGDLVSGAMVLTFDGAGRATVHYEDITFESAIDRTSSMRSILSGTFSWTYTRRPWDARLAGVAAPSGPGVDAMTLERVSTGGDARWRVQFVGRGGVVGESSRPFRGDNSGSRAFSAAVCEGGELRLRPGALPNDPGPPWTGTYRRM